MRYVLVHPPVQNFLMSTCDPSDLFAKLDGLDKAEPMSTEDDLVLRMQAVSKMRNDKGGNGRNPMPNPSKGIKKKRKRERKTGKL